MTELTLIWEASVSPAYCWLQFRYSYLCVRVCCCGLGEPAVNPLSNMVERLPHLFLFHKTEQRSLLSLVDHGGGIKAALVYCRLSSSTFKIVVIILYSSRLRLWKKKSSWGFALSSGSVLVVGESFQSGNWVTSTVQREPLICWDCISAKEIHICSSVFISESWKPPLKPTAGPLQGHCGHTGILWFSAKSIQSCIVQVLHSTLKKHAYRETE